MRSTTTSASSSNGTSWTAPGAVPRWPSTARSPRSCRSPGASAPDGVWDRIASELVPAGAPDAHDDLARRPARTEPDDTVTSLSDAPSVRRRTSSNRSRTLLALLAAAACIVAVLGFVAVGQSNRLNKLETAIAQDDMDSLVKQTKENSEVSVQLTGEAGDASAVVGKDGRGFLLMDEVPAPPRATCTSCGARSTAR